MNIMLKNVRLAFNDLFVAKAFEDNPAKFGCTLLVKKGSETDKAIQAAVEQVAKEKWGAKADSMLQKIRKNNKCGYRDGDEEAYDGFEGNMALKTSNSTRPLLVNKDKTPITAEDGVLYAGCYVNAKVSIFAYEKQSAGISATIMGVQFAADGERFGGGGVAEVDEFEDLSEGATADDFMG